jgi:hypothetical protein
MHTEAIFGLVCNFPCPGLGQFVGQCEVTREAPCLNKLRLASGTEPDLFRQHRKSHPLVMMLVTLHMIGKPSGHVNNLCVTVILLATDLPQRTQAPACNELGDGKAQTASRLTPNFATISQRVISGDKAWESRETKRCPPRDSIEDRAVPGLSRSDYTKSWQSCTNNGNGYRA